VHGGLTLGEEGNPEDVDLRVTARRFLEFQRGFLRRRWAPYYAIWACAVTAYFLVPFLLGFTQFATSPTPVRLLTLTGLDLLLTVAAVAISLLLWGLAERTSNVRSAADGRPTLTSRRNLLRFAIVVAIVVGILAVSTRSSFASSLLVDTVIVALSLLLLFHLHRAFRRIPPEGWLAASAFIAAAAFSFVSLLLLDYPLGHEVGWSAAVVVWLGCAAYARFAVRDDSEGS
jgi:hypothetical protein